MASFEELVLVVRHLTNRNNIAGFLSGNLLVDTPAMLIALQSCEADHDNTALTLLEPVDISLVMVGGVAHIEIGTPRPGFGLLPENLDALLCYQSAHFKEPSRYLLLDTNHHNSDHAPPGHAVAAYRAVLEFVAMLKLCSAFLDEQQEILFFIREGKFEVPIVYYENNLINIDIETITVLSNVLTDDIHKEQRASIMVESVYEITAMLPSSKRFISLLEHSNDLKERFNRGYRLFAAGFSYGKIRDEIEAARVEYSGKIHKIFSDIQNQLLGIPVATIIVATQMKVAVHNDSNLLTNTAILLGSFIFALLMHFLLINQGHTLEIVNMEINRQRIKLGKDHAAIAENFIDTFKSLDVRCKTQHRLLRIIDIIVIVGFLTSILFYYNMNIPVQQWVIKFITAYICK